VLLGLWPQMLSRAESRPAETPEPLRVRGTPGHSAAHARVDLREIAAEEAAARAGMEESREELTPEHEPPWKDLPLPPGARVLREVPRPQAQSTGLTLAPSPPLASSFRAIAWSRPTPTEPSARTTW